MNHSWENNVCVRCGLRRKRKAWKQLMAIVNHPPWEGYMRGVDWAYSINGNDFIFKRPDCKTMISEPNDNRSVASKADQGGNDDNKKIKSNEKL